MTTHDFFQMFAESTAVVSGDQLVLQRAVGEGESGNTAVKVTAETLRAYLTAGVTEHLEATLGASMDTALDNMRTAIGLLESRAGATEGVTTGLWQSVDALTAAIAAERDYRVEADNALRGERAVMIAEERDYRRAADEALSARVSAIEGGAVFLTEAEYEYLSGAGRVDEGKMYYIFEEE